MNQPELWNTDYFQKPPEKKTWWRWVCGLFCRKRPQEIKLFTSDSYKLGPIKNRENQ